MAAGPLLAVVLIAYLGGVRRLGRLGRAWPAGRTACVVAGAAVVAGALVVDGRRSFTAHAGQHLLLGMVAPALFVLAAPVTLALLAGGPGLRRRLRRTLHRRPAVVLAHPLTAWALFGGSLVALYLTPLYRLSLEHGWLHEVVHVHFLVAGAVFFAAVLGVDPAPRRLPHGARLLMVFLAIPFHAVLGMALLAARQPLAPAHSLADHRAGSGLLWIGGDLLGLVAVLVVAARWMADEERRAGREDRRASLVEG